MLKSDDERIVVNDHIQGDPLSEENLDKTLNFLHRFRLLTSNKTIWIYSGYKIEDIFRHFYNGEYVGYPYYDKSYPDKLTSKRQEILRQCDVLVDGRYIDSQRDITKKWAGSSNQRVIDLKRTLKQNKLVLYCD